MGGRGDQECNFQLFGCQTEKYLRLFFLQIDHQILSACLKNGIEKKIEKRADYEGLELNYSTVKGWAQVNVAYLDVYVIKNMEVVTY